MALANLRQDLVYAARTLRKSPGFTAAVVLTLALGIGANSAIFSLVYAALLRPLPYPQAERLAFVSTGKAESGVFHSGVSSREFDEWRPHLQRLFEEFATVSGNPDTTWTAAGIGSHLKNRDVSANFFAMLGVRPLAGRLFTTEDTAPGHGDVAVLSYETWQKQFGGDPQVLGQRMRKKGSVYPSYLVIGILPGGFEFDEVTDVWTPQQPPTPDIADNRNVRRIRAIGRLRQDTAIGQAQAALNTLAAQEAEAFPASNKGWGIRAASLRDHFAERRPLGLLLLWAAVGCLLWIACANTANLLLSRAEGRRREIGIRLALGASRPRLMAQLLTESSLLALIGGGVGLALAASLLGLLRFWGSALLPVAALQDVARLHAGALDPAVLGFTLGAAMLSVVLFGVLPARRAARLDLNQAFQGSAGGRTTHSTRLSQMLVAAEVAVVMVLALSAGLLVRSLMKLQAVDPGFRTANRVAFDIELPRLADTWTPANPIPRAESRRRFQGQVAWFEELEQRLQTVPGVRAAGASNAFPLLDEGGGWGVKLGDRQLPASTSMAFVTPGYFEAVGAPIVEGSNFGPAHYDDPVSKPLVVNQAMARLLFPEGGAVGRHVKAPRCGISVAHEQRLSDCVIIGVAQDTRFSLDTPAPPTFYYSIHQDAGDRLTYALRAAGDPAPLLAAVRATVAGMPTINGGPAYLFHLQTLEELRSNAVATPRFRSWLVALFAGIALLLASVGIYGVQSYAVTLRTREIGIRMALGARPATVFRVILGTAARWTLLGIVVGLSAGMAATKLIASLLFGVSRTDWVTLVVSPLVLLAVALAAAYIPARRAMRVDPLTALRSE